MTKRRAVAAAISSLGIARVVRRLLRNRLAVLAYHRVGEGATLTSSAFDDFVYSCSAVEFERQLNVLSETRRFVTLADVIDAFRGRLSLPSCATLLTFDDATSDHYRVVFPILARRGIQGVFFVPTRSVVERRVEWWNLLGYALKNCAAGTYSLGRYCGDIVHLDTPAQRSKAFVRVSQAIKANALQADVSGIVDELLVRLGVDAPPREVQSAELMTLDDVAEMARAGMEIGSHTHSHVFLNRLDLEAQRKEMQISKEILENAIDRPVLAVSYPYGLKRDYDRRSVLAAQQAGYSCAFNMAEVSAIAPSPEGIFDIGRFTPPVRADERFLVAISGMRI